MTSIGNTIKYLRKSKGMTQDELAAALFVTRQTVSNYENGKSQPDFDTLNALAKILCVEVEAFIEGLPALKERKRNIKITVVSIILAVLVLAVYIFMLSVQRVWEERLLVYPIRIVRATIHPIMYLVVSWTAMQVLSLILKASPLKRPKIFWVFTCFLTAYFIFILPALVHLSIISIKLMRTESFYVIEEMVRYTDIVCKITEYPFLFIVPGVGLWVARRK